MTPVTDVWPEEIVALLLPGSSPGAIAAMLSRGRQAVDPIARFLLGPSDPIPHPRQAAARWLGVLGGEKARVALEEALFLLDRPSEDPVLRFSDETVSETAADQLKRIGDRVSIPPLRAALERFRLINAAEALASFQDSASLPAIIAALDDDFRRGRLEEAILSFGSGALASLESGARALPSDETGPTARRRDSVLGLIGRLNRADSTR